MKTYMLAFLAAVLAISLVPAGHATGSSCALDVTNLDARDGAIEATVKNIGQQNTGVDVRFFVGNELVRTKHISLDRGSSQTVSLDYNFPTGSTDVEVEADAGCGSRASEQLTHIVLSSLGDYNHGSGYGLYGRQPVYTQPETCGVSISEMGFTQRTVEGQPVESTVNVENTGNGQQIDVTLFLDGTLKEKFSQTASGSFQHTFQMFPQAGEHKMTVLAEAGCGMSDMLVKDFEVSKETVPIITQPTISLAPTETAVSFNPANLDVSVGDSKAVVLSITTSHPQAFTITTEGLPGDWISFEPHVQVSDRKDVFVLVTPKNLGTKEFNIYVKAGDEGTTFAKKIVLYGSLPATLSSRGGQPDYLALLRNPLAQAGIAALAVIILILVGMALLRRYDVETVQSYTPERERKERGQSLQRIKAMIRGVKEPTTQPKVTSSGTTRYSGILQRIKKQIES